MTKRAFEALVVPLAAATRAHGNKAATLAKLIQAAHQDIRVPQGVAIAADAHTAWLESLEDAAGAEHILTEITQVTNDALITTVGEQAKDMRWIVRSSSQAEDGPTRTAAGIFESVGDVGFTELTDAIATVWRSTHSDVAAAYGVDRAPMGVIVQQYCVGATASAYLYQEMPAIVQWKEPGALAAHVWQESDAAPRATHALQIAKIAQRALDLLPNADVELICATSVIYVVQARPLQPPRIVATNAPTAELFAFSRAQSKVIWRLDLEHNPAPLSVAQTELVNHIAAQPWMTTPMRIVGSYLYYAERPTPDSASIAVPTAAALRQAMTSIAEEMQALLTPWANHNSPALNLKRALAIYTSFYKAWTQRVSPLLRAARAVVAADAIAASGTIASASTEASNARPNAPAAILRQVASGEKTAEQASVLLQNVAVTWDVASPVLGEDPSYISAWAMRYRLTQPNGVVRAAAPPDSSPPCDSLASELAYWEEADDYWFYDAQAIVRHALLALGKTRDIGELVMWVPWDDLTNDARSTAQLIDVAQRHQAAHTAATRVSMPLRFTDGTPLIEVVATAAITATDTNTTTYSGLCIDDGGLPASGLVGVAVHLTESSATFGNMTGRIAICASITPATALALAGMRAIIAATGGPLDHGAAIARELGIPAIVGCTRCTEIASGTIVHIATTGTVTVRA